MADRYIAAAKAVERLPAEHLGNQSDIPVAIDDAVVVDSDPAAFLAAVLQGIQREVGARRHIGALLLIDPENAALLMQSIQQHAFLPRLFPEQTAHHLVISALDAAHIAAETILVQLFAGPAVPKAAGIG